jgi:hypothetical protein
MTERPRSLNSLFVLLLAATLLVLVSCVWGLAQWRLGAGLEELRESRFRFSLITVRNGLETGLRLGFNPPELPGAQQLIDNALEREKDILSIDVFDNTGRILFTTDQGGLGATVATSWRSGCFSASAGEVWRQDDDNNALQCIAAVNSLEIPVAGVMLRYQLRERAGVGSTLTEHWAALLGLLGGCLLLGGLAGWWALRPLERQLQTDAQTLSGGDVSAALDNTLSGQLRSAMVSAAQINEEIQDIELATTRLDQIDTP